MTDSKFSSGGGPLGDLLGRVSEFDFEGLNEFYRGVEEAIRARVREGEVEGVAELLRVRLLAPLVSLYLVREAELPESDKGLPDRGTLMRIRRASLRAVLEVIGLEEAPFEVEDENLLNAAREFASALVEGSGEALEEGVARLQIFEVGGKQALVSRTGGFADMRGASAMIDIASRVAAEGVSEILGAEFVLTCEAGEVVFLSPSGLAGRIEEVLLRRYVLNDEVCPHLGVLLYRSNGETGLDVSARDLLEKFGEAFLASILSLRDLNVEGGEDYVKAGLICRNCRRDRGLSDDEMRGLAEKVVSRREELEGIHLSVKGGYETLCKTCYVTRLYAKALIDLLSGLEDRYTESFVKCVKEASAYKALTGAVDVSRREEYGNYVFNVEEYDVEFRGERKQAVFGLVYGDGDGFGSLKKSAKSIFDFYLLSLFFSELMGEGVARGISRVLDLDVNLARVKKPGKYPIPITPLFVAGDDFLLGLRGEYTYVFVKGFYEGASRVYESFKFFLSLPLLSEEFRRLAERRIGVSMGVAVGKTRVPGVFLYEASARVLRFAKEVGKRAGGGHRFGVQAALVYSKSRVSWSLVDRLTALPPREEDYGRLYGYLIYFNDRDGECPIGLALKAALCRVDGRVRAAHLKDITEEFLVEDRHPLMAFARVINDIARGMKSEDEESQARAENMKRMVEIFVKTCEIDDYSWMWFYVIASILDMVENREDLLGEEFGYEVLRRFAGC